MTLLDALRRTGMARNATLFGNGRTVRALTDGTYWVLSPDAPRYIHCASYRELVHELLFAVDGGWQPVAESEAHSA